MVTTCPVGISIASALILLISASIQSLAASYAENSTQISCSYASLRGSLASNHLPMWSREFSRRCCDVYPATIRSTAGSFFEHGDLLSASYFNVRKMKHGDTVYVVTSDIPVFIDRFLKLPASARIILVTGSEDIGAPYEVFHPHRPNFFDYNMNALWPNGQKIKLSDFLADPRLVRWYAQNYDLVGCNLYTCSPFKAKVNSTSGLQSSNSGFDSSSGSSGSSNNKGRGGGHSAPTKSVVIDAQIFNKVVPIPIGIDLHSASEKKTSDPQAAASKVCSQLTALQTAKQQALPFARRKMAVVAEFGCGFDQTKIGVARSKARGELCSLIKKVKSTAKPGTLQWLLDVSSTYDSSRISSTSSSSSSSSNKKVVDDKLLSYGDSESDVAVVISQSDMLHSSGPQSASTSSSSSARSSQVQGQGKGPSLDESGRNSHHINTASDSFDATRSSFWKKLGVFAFALSPPGYGMDTHRLWEILHMGAVPIALHSPLDALYSQFPVVLVNSWAEVFQPGALLKFKKDILARFPEMAGGGPVSTPSYKEKLEAAYWAELIATEKRKITGI